MKEEKTIKTRFIHTIIEVIVIAGTIILVSYILAVILLGVR